MSHDLKMSISEWPDSKKYPRSIRFHFSLLVAGIVLVLMATTSLMISEKHASVVTSGVVQKLLAQARSYSSTASKHLLAADGPDALMLNNICRRLSDESDDIYWAAIAGTDRQLIAHTHIREIASVGNLPDWSAAGEAELRTNESYAVDGDTVRINVPIREQDLTLGSLELTASAAPIKSSRTQSLITMASITIGVLLLGLPLTLLLLHRKLRPISTITEHLRNTDLENLQLDIPIRTRNEFGYLADTLRVMGHKVSQAQSQLVEQERMTRELEIAREIQGKILPRTFPRHERFESFGYYQSAKEVGGDYFDFVEVDSNRLGLLVADVSGKSLPGMLVMLLTRDIVRQHSRAVANPAELLQLVNNELLQNIKKGMFVTMFYGILDINSGRFEFSSAGHNPLLHVDSSIGRVNQYRPKGFPLGLMPSAQFDKRIEIHTLDLQPGDTVVQYSDGINEAQNAAGEEYGMERFVNSLASHHNESSERLVNRLLAPLSEFVGATAQYDDITLLTLKWLSDSDQTKARERAAISYEHQS